MHPKRRVLEIRRRQRALDEYRVVEMVMTLWEAKEFFEILVSVMEEVPIEWQEDASLVMQFICASENVKSAMDRNTKVQRITSLGVVKASPSPSDLVIEKEEENKRFLDFVHRTRYNRTAE